MAGERQGEGEAAIIRALAPLAAGYPGAFGLTDDCAAFTPTPGTDLVVKTDPVAAGVHFFPDDRPEDIGWKALAVNVSDLAAKAAVPRVYLMALSFPEAPASGWVAGLARGLAEAQQAFGMHLIGGDTDRRPGPTTISVTVLGEVPTGTMLQRGTARPGDLIYVSGTLGDARAGLEIRRDPTFAARHGLDAASRDYLLDRYLRPSPRLGLRAALRSSASAAMDISDGLAKDLGRMCLASGCGARIEAGRLPLSTAVIGARPGDGWSPTLAALSAGDDYEVLFTVPPHKAQTCEAEAGAAGIAITCIGAMTAAGGVEIIGRDGKPVEIATAGYDHF